MKVTKKVFSVILSVLMVLSVLPLAASGALAAPADEAVYATAYDGLGDYAAPALGEGGEGEGGADVSIPAQFSLVDNMPAARDQNPYGSCWAFGTVAAAESNIITQGFESKDSIDLSEMQLIYYMYHPTVDPLGNITPGEGSYRSDGELIDGGRSDYAMNVLSHWNGLAGETDHANFTYGEYGSNVGALNGDWDESLATDYNDYIINGYYAINLADADLLKSAIVENGAAATGYTHFYNCIYEGEGVDGEYTVNYYSGADPYSNTGAGGGHAVAIVGWDDNYAKENFAGKFQPENDGAWLIRNSWGDDWGLDGYFWMSYEEKTMDSTAFIAIMQKAGAYDNNYFYDGGAIYYPSAKVLGAVNKFTAQGDEILKAVSVVFPEDANVNYTVEIYKNYTDNSFIKTDEPVEVTTGTTTFAGMYTIELDNPVALAAGDKFAVVIRADGPVVISYDKYSEYEHGWFVNNATWEDDSSYFINGYGDLASMASRGVARIKAYTDVVDENTVTITAEDVVMCVGGTAALNAAADPETAALTYSIADESIATVDDTGVVTGVAAGATKAVIRNAADNAKATVTVTVNAHDIEDVAAVDATCTAEGSAAYSRCKACGKIFIDGVEATAEQIEALKTDKEDHNMTAFDAVEATDYEDGNIAYWYCDKCETYYADAEGNTPIDLADTVVLARYTKVKVAEVPANCTEDGNIEYYEVYDKATGEFVKYVDADLEEIDLADTVVKAGHAFTKHDAVDPVCETGVKGNVEYYTCDNCSKYFIKSVDEETGDETYTETTYSAVILNATHDMTYTAAVAATCTEDGNIAYYTCKTCGQYFKYKSGSTKLTAEQLVVPAKGHKAKAIAANDPSCTVDGNIAYYVCTACEKLFSDEACTAEITKDSTVIAATGHDYVGEETTPASCILPGLMTYTCANGCGSSYTEIILPLGHDYDENNVCTRCGLSKDEVEQAEIQELGGEICEYCGRRHGTSWFASFLYAVHRVFKFLKDAFAKIG